MAEDRDHADPKAGVLIPEAILTWDSIRRLEDMTDIGPGRVGRLMIEANFRQHRYNLGLLRDAGFDV